MDALIHHSSGDNAIFHYPGDRVIAVSEGIPSSMWSLWLVMYQVALTSAVSVLD